VSVLHAADVVVVWMHDGKPARLIWDGTRYRVSDEPTRLSDLLFEVTHPPMIDGWRFQGTDETGQSKVFDVRRTVAGWELVRVYD
jgi:hypothetical protein